MATKTNKRPQKKELPQIAGPRIPTDPPLLDLPKAALTKLTRSAKQRSYVTRGQINSGLPSEDQDSEIADSLSISSEIGVNVVEVLPKAETKEPIERAGDPVRMYLRESRSIADQAKTSASQCTWSKASTGLCARPGSCSMKWAANRRRRSC
jgi:Sigma-70 factor, region 1.1